MSGTEERKEGNLAVTKHVTDGSPCWCNPIRQVWNKEKKQWTTVNTAATTMTSKD